VATQVPGVPPSNNGHVAVRCLEMVIGSRVPSGVEGVAVYCGNCLLVTPAGGSKSSSRRVLGSAACVLGPREQSDHTHPLRGL
jgi:hypothetical protein